MLENICLKNFKNHENLSLELRNLNLFTGINSTGKSSVIQSLLLLRHGYEKTPPGPDCLIKEYSLPAGGGTEEHLINFSIPSSFLHFEASDSFFTIEVQSKDSNFFVRVLIDREKEDIDKIRFTAKNPLALSLFQDEKFQYICTDRRPPSPDYPRGEDNIAKDNLGKRGQYTASYLAEYGQNELKLRENLRHPNAKNNNIAENTMCWLQEISGDVRFSLEKRPRFSDVVIEFHYGGSKFSVDPQNLGFGLSYALPVIVALLKADKEDIVIIENPETHLHPAGQSAMGRLAALAAGAGVQVILESHSDHVLNALRVEVKEGRLPAEQVRIYYAERNKENPFKSKVHHIDMDSDGYIDHWPEGFFDEFEKSLERLL